VTVASRLRTLAAAVTAVVAPLALAPAALADTATPENPVGPASHAIDNIYRAVIGTTMVIFILVGGWLVYSAIRFRARPGRPVDPPQVHGSSRLEWGWTIVPVLILIGLIPFAGLGIFMGHMLSTDSIGPAMGGTTAFLSLLGGVWFPITSSSALHDLAEALPSYWLVQASHVALGGRGWDGTGWLVVAAWAVAMALLAARAYQRDTARP